MTRPDAPPGQPLSYAVDPARVSGGRSRSVLAIAAIAILAIGSVVGGLALLAGPAEPRVAIDVAASAIVPIGTIGPVVTTEPAAPPAITCHTVAQVRCRALARAALEVAAEPALAAIDSVDVWPTLSCSSDFDCPRDRLQGSRPAGSAILVTAAARRVWVNVTDRDLDGGAFDRAEHRLDAWVFRSDGV